MKRIRGVVVREWAVLVKNDDGVFVPGFTHRSLTEPDARQLAREVGGWPVYRDVGSWTIGIDCEVHVPVQHRDGKAPWCDSCKLDRNGLPPADRFAGVRR